MAERQKYAHSVMSLSSFADKYVQVFGITGNDAESHQKFSEENNLNFPLLLDTNKNLALLFGAVQKPDEQRFKRLTVYY